ncbi:hypothetical protein [Microbacterium foliorum]|uniref:hypothetical protein n=1 Tax=Microbacterium foliorum TaxID=104336 RepID=UPI0028D27562|nr:hypothetical protein [Microbacterium foliorum]
MSKSTPLSVQNAFNSALSTSKENAAAIRAAHNAARQAILNDQMTSDLAKRGKLDMLKIDTRDKLAALKESQESFIKGLRDKVEKEFRGHQPADGASVVSRRDAADRARKLDRREAMEVLQDAIAGNDADFAHAIGVRARNVAWVDVAEAYQDAFRESAGSAEALAYLDSNGPGTAGYNLNNSATFAAPLD